jgi:hypothetical protein
MHFVDKPFPNDTPIVSPENAFMTGALKTDNLEDLRRFERVFPLDPKTLVDKALEVRDFYEKRGSLPTSKEKMDILFLDLCGKLFRADEAKGWTATLHFNIEGADEYTIQVVDGELKGSSTGLEGAATCTINSSYDNWRKVLRYEMLEDSGLVEEKQLDNWQDEESLDSDLSDEMLEAVAGGKGSCGAEAAASTACGADACGAALGYNVACGAAACGGDASINSACGAAACGAAVGAYGVCGADACGAAAGIGTACGAAAGVGACAGDACGAAVGAGVCAGNVCGIDILAGADVGPCGVNVIPLVPGC